MLNKEQILADQARNERILSRQKVLFKPKQGKNRIRLLPPWKVDEKGLGVPYYEALYHFSLGPEGKIAVPCLKSIPGARCPICEAVEPLKNAVNPVDREKYDDCRAKARILYNIIALDDPNLPVLIYPVGRTLHKQFMTYMA